MMDNRVPEVMIIAGEASGDLHGACLAAGLKQAVPDIIIRGIGSRKMREAGVRLIYDSSAWSAIGITEALKVVPRLLAAMRVLKGHLEKNPPDVLVLIDFGAFNVRICRSLQAGKTKVLYYFPPSSWKRNAVYDDLKGCVDKIITPFPWSAENLCAQGFDAEFFGHPLLDVTKPSLPADEFFKRFGFNPDIPIIGLLPGSRKHEIVHHVPVMAVTATMLQDSMTELQFAVPVAPSVDAESLADELRSVPWIDLQSHIKPDTESGRCKSSFGIKSNIEMLYNREPERKVRITLIPGMTADILARSRAAVISSGTATVEAAILGCPMVIIYRAGQLAALEYRLRGKNIKFIGMPNIIADKMICPELILDNAVPEKIFGIIRNLADETPYRAEMLRELVNVKSMLGSTGAIEKTVNTVIGMLSLDIHAKSDRKP